jgi:diguanylate cyclase (GGDEF)-like protein/PAS domain S-box-containing protein
MEALPPLILIVDDDEDVRDMLRNFLENEGYRVEEAKDGQKALHILDTLRPALILVDANMPVMDGFETCIGIRSNPEQASIPLIMVTALEDNQSVDQAFAAGAEEYITKPIHFSVLRQRIRIILKHRQAEQRLMESELQFRSVTQLSIDAIIVADERGVVISWNHGAEVIFGYKKREILEKPLVQLMPEQFRESHSAAVERMVITGESRLDNKVVEMAGLRKDGREFPLEISLSSWTARGKRFFSSVIRDITDRKKLEEQLKRQAEFDHLTNLPNRALFQDRLLQAILATERSNSIGALLFIDLDRFKWVNDTLGHEAGDILLQEVAKRLTACVRKTDTVARLGGDEFTVVLSTISSRTFARKVAKKILKQLATPFIIEKEKVQISGSIGITFFPQDGFIMDDLMKNADIAMYRAKKSGRNRFRLYEKRMHSVMPPRMS